MLTSGLTESSRQHLNLPKKRQGRRLIRIVKDRANGVVFRLYTSHEEGSLGPHISGEAT